MLYYNNEIYYVGKVMEKKLLKRSLSFAMMIAVVFSTIIASSFIKANAAEQKSSYLNPRRKYFSTRYSTGSCGRSCRRQYTGCNYTK